MMYYSIALFLKFVLIIIVFLHNSKRMLMIALIIIVLVTINFYCIDLSYVHDI